MATRRKILRELHHFHGEWPNSLLGARDIGAFRRDDAAFAAAASELVAEGLILTTGDKPSEAGFRLNPERISDWGRELRPPLWRVVLLAMLSLLAGAAAFRPSGGSRL
jgi:hypothetical protein